MLIFDGELPAMCEEGTVENILEGQQGVEGETVSDRTAAAVAAAAY